MGACSVGSAAEGTAAAGAGMASVLRSGTASTIGLSACRVSAAAGVGSAWSSVEAFQPSVTGGLISAGLSLNVFKGPLAAGAAGGVVGRADAAGGVGTVSYDAAVAIGREGAPAAGMAAAAGMAGAVGIGFPQESSGTFVTTVRGIRTV